MHTLEAIIKTHWGLNASNDCSVDHYSLQYAAGKMARHFVSSQKQIYCYARTFMKNNLYGRILAEFINYLSDIDKYYDQFLTYTTANSIHAIIEKLSIPSAKKIDYGHSGIN